MTSHRVDSPVMNEYPPCISNSPFSCILSYVFVTKADGCAECVCKSDHGKLVLDLPERSKVWLGSLGEVLRATRREGRG